MSYNNIEAIKFKVKCSLEDIQKFVDDAGTGYIENIYGYNIKNKFDDNVKKYWIVNIRYIGTKKYDTYSFKDSIIEIADILRNDLIENSQNEYLAYKQAPIEIMLELFDPLVMKMAIEQQQRWPVYETEDLAQICRQCMFELYKKKYYIHKGLLRRTFINRIWCEQRRNRNKGQSVPLSSFDDEAFAETYINEITDKNAILKQERAEEVEQFERLFKELKPILVSIFSERRIKMLLLDFANKNITQADKSMIRKIREVLEKQGIDEQWFKAHMSGGEI